ncbi:MAG: hypothetical protein LBN00_00515 [Oscillospiraceae bacterium]|nr:hypothetical protein [Oscillospiraceae bacterium]
MTKSCFVLMPFTSRYLDDYYEYIIKPAVSAMDFDVVRADEIYGTQPVITDIFEKIRNAALIIADVTGRNPNVNYELGAAHMCEKKVIIISQSMDDVPFDYRHRRIIVYDVQALNFKEKLVEDIQNTIKTLFPDRADIIQTALEPDSAGYYEDTIAEVYPNIPHTFYRLRGLLPASELPSGSERIADETHWLAIWDNTVDGKRIEFRSGNKVRFRVQKVSKLDNYKHVKHARNVTVTDISVV